MSTKYVTVGSPKEVVIPDENTVIKITVEKPGKIKGHKYTSSVTSKDTGQKATAEKKQSTTSNSGTVQNWGVTLGKQSLQCIKQAQLCKSTKQTEKKEIKRNPHAQQRNVYSGNKRANAISPKKVSSQKRSEGYSKASYCKNCEKPLTLMNSTSTVFVQDRAVQCSEVFNDFNKFGDLIYTLHCLVKEMNDMVKKDKRTSEIFIEMEQILSRIAAGSGKSILEDVEYVVMHSKLKESTAKLKESNKAMKEMCKSWASKQETMQSEIEKQDEHIKESEQKRIELENHVKMLTQELAGATRTIKIREGTILALKQQIRNDEPLEKIISDLKTELVVQTELARNRHNNIQYLEMERDKLSMLSSYKDTLITEFRSTIIELQNQAKELNEVYMNEGNTSSQVSGIHTGPVCSSPNSRSSDHTNDPALYRNFSDTSLSTVEHIQEHVILNEDATVKDSKHFISLPVEESSHTIIPDSYKSLVMYDEETMTRNQNRNSTAFYRNENTDHLTTKKSLHHLSKKGYDKENNVSKTKEFTKFDRRMNDDIKTPFHCNASKILTNIASNKPMVSDIQKQVQNMLDNIQNRIPVSIPSPLRDCPHPDWSDSSLPSVSTVSELDIVPSNDI